ncbi:MAG: hypothetical protein GY822_06625 [Deltaproteobacteria bacterium]|nr:hypothetical protein [Deltaproteobacteria bacterium]
MAHAKMANASSSAFHVPAKSAPTLFAQQEMTGNDDDSETADDALSAEAEQPEQEQENKKDSKKESCLRVWVPDFTSASENIRAGDLETATALATLFAGRGRRFGSRGARLAAA